MGVVATGIFGWGAIWVFASFRSDDSVERMPESLCCGIPNQFLEASMANIVLGYIDNDEGNLALDLAIEQTRLRVARLFVVHSLRGGTHTSPEEINAARAALDVVAERLTEEGIDFEIEDYVRGNSPADDILAAAADYHAELIVIGYQRRSAAGKLLLGSKALQVMIDAPCPVLGVATP